MKQQYHIVERKSIGKGKKIKRDDFVIISIFWKFYKLHTRGHIPAEKEICKKTVNFLLPPRQEGKIKVK